MSDNIAKAAEIGKEHGTNAARWIFDGNTDQETYLYYLNGIQDGDPEVLDALPQHAGEYEEHSDYTARDLERDLGIDPDTESEDFADVWDAYTTAFDAAVQDEITRIARYHVEK